MTGCPNCEALGVERCHLPGDLKMEGKIHVIRTGGETMVIQGNPCYLCNKTGRVPLEVAGIYRLTGYPLAMQRAEKIRLQRIGLRVVGGMAVAAMFQMWGLVNGGIGFIFMVVLAWCLWHFKAPNL